MIKALNTLIYSCFFLSCFVWQGVVQFDLKLIYLVLLLFISLVLLYGKALIINRCVLLVLVFFTCVSFVMVWLGNAQIFSILSTALGIEIFCIATFTFFSINQNQIPSVAKRYISIAVLLAGLSLVQQLCFVLQLKYGYDYSYFLPIWRFGGFEGFLMRVNSLFPEPAHFAYFLSPALFLSVRRLFFREFFFVTRTQSLIIFAANLLTFSSIAYLSLILCVLFSLPYKKLCQKPLRIFTAALFLCTLIILAVTKSESVSIRVNSVIDLLASNSSSLQNPSVFAFYSNFLVAKDSFFSNPIFGSGLNSSYTNYLEHLGNYFDVNYVQELGLFGLTARDTGSLFLRIPSELGLFGIAVLLLFLWRFKVRKSINYKYYVLSKMCLLFFVVYALRIGHYFLFELWFFMAMYVYLHKKQHDSTFSRD
ncbi:MAG: hypothetical protein WA919_16110 [Coleofasciculaceae cyanobacterium]